MKGAMFRASRGGAVNGLARSPPIGGKLPDITIRLSLDVLDLDIRLEVNLVTETLHFGQITLGVDQDSQVAGGAKGSANNVEHLVAQLWLPRIPRGEI